ncbi:MAG: RDD family protein [Terriglobia bacterium]
MSESDRARVDKQPPPPPPERKENPRLAEPELPTQQTPPVKMVPVPVSFSKGNVSESDRARVDKQPPPPPPERKENPRLAEPEFTTQPTPPVKMLPVPVSFSKENVSESDDARVDKQPPPPPPERKENPRLAEPEFTTQPTPPAETAPVPVSFFKGNVSESDRARVDKQSHDWIKELSERVETFRSESDRPRVDEQPEDWREELSERVENFRKRRARLQPDAAPAGNLELDFGGFDTTEINRSIDDAVGAPAESDSGFDLEIGESAVAHDNVILSPEPHSLEEPADEIMQLDAAPAESGEMSLGEALAKRPPMEILVDSPGETGFEEEEGAEEIFLAPLSRRFLAGLADALVLILGAGVFGIIFWRCCGRLSIIPLNIAVIGLVAVILIFAYFAVFTAIACATPGLLWMGCEIRNMDGGRPTVRESFWRAFGVLVSLSALMLGFIWACVDTDSLTWHDHMSQTLITDAVITTDLAGQKVQT